MAQVDLRFVHISDLHILADPDRRQYGVDTGAILRQAIPLLNSLRPDFVVAGGDLSGDGSEDSYRRLQQILQPLAAPTHLLMGNHDDRTRFRRIFHPHATPTADPVEAAFEVGGMRFVLLDSSLPGKEEGAFSADQLRWLDRELGASAGRLTWVFLHHQPLPIYVRWLDQIGLSNSEAFLATLACHPHVAAVAYGHVHQARSWRYGSALFIGLPALAFQFSPISQEPEVTQDSPGFRVIEITGGEMRHWLYFLDGRIVSEPRLPAIPIYVR